MAATDQLKLFLAGDVMTGRGVDQVLPYPGNPILYEDYVQSACDYVELAEKVNGPIPQSLSFGDIWGDALAVLDRARPDLRLINLETAVTSNAEAFPKGINYRMNPRNAKVLTAAQIDGCVLANNHTLDWEKPGLLETIDTLRSIGIAPIGAGRNAGEAMAPAIFRAGSGRVLVFAYGSPTSGVPRSWAAAEDRPGVNLLPDLTSQALDRVRGQIARAKRPGDIAVVSLHWGPNWGYDVPMEQVRFAHGLIDTAGADLVWGHSSHHPKAVEVYRGKLVLYGCGDFLNDYEGIRGHDSFRGDLVLMYIPRLSMRDGRLQRLDMVPFRIRRFSLHRAGRSCAAWLQHALNRPGGPGEAKVELTADDTLVLPGPA